MQNIDVMHLIKVEPHHHIASNPYNQVKTSDSVNIGTAIIA